jgi:hypothetical protein
MTMASAMYLAGLQASITVPRIAFNNCLKKAEASAKAEKVGADNYADYLRNACAAEGNRLKTALIAFDVKNGVARGRAAADAENDITEGFASSASTYKWQASQNKPADAN